MANYLRRLFIPSGRLALLGLCFLQAWMFVVSQRLVFRTVGFQLSFHIGMCAALLMTAATARWAEQVGVAHRALDVVSAVVLTALPLMGVLAQVGALALGDIPASAPLASGAVCGAAIGWGFARWFDVYCVAPARDGICCLLIAFSIGAVLCLLLGLFSSASPVIPLLAVACFPPLSLFTLERARAVVLDDPDAGRELAGSGTPPAARLAAAVDRGGGRCPQSRGAPAARGRAAAPDDRRRRQVASLVFQVVVYALVFGNGAVFSALQEDAGAADPSLAFVLNYALRAALPALLALWIAAQSSDEASSLRASLNAVLLALVFAILLIWFVGDLGGAVAYALVGAARNLVLVLLYAALVKLAHVTRANPYAVFGVGRGVYELSLALGIAGYATLSAGSALSAWAAGGAVGDGLVYATAVCVLVFLVGCFFATAQGLDEADAAPVPRGPAFSPGDGPVGGAPEGDEGRWSELRERYGMSERECQVARLFCQGRSKRAVGEALGLSENTVRWYLQQLYGRMGVHSRDELLALVEGAPRSQAGGPAEQTGGPAA